MITILKNNISFTPYHFYNDFLNEVANFYSKNKTRIIFQLFENGEDKNSYYRIDPVSIPLLLSLVEQLSKFHDGKIELILHNNNATIDVLEFLFKSEMFYVCGDNKNPNFPKGRNFALFDDKHFGAFIGKSQRKDHKIRVYSLEDDNLFNELKKYSTEDEKRDFLLSHYSYKASEHFEGLLFDNEYTSQMHNVYISILSELITNGVLHSKSNTFALMFVDRFKTKFSISDNGVGFETSMQTKQALFYYKPSSLKTILSEQKGLKNISERILNNLYMIFEILYYSSLKERKGLFDLMISVVLNSKGYFRLHSENCQIIISNRMMDELIELELYRNKIYELHNNYLLKLIDENNFKESILIQSEIIKKCFVSFFNKAVEKYNSDIKYSSLRFFKVKFRGVHIEVEIPNV